MLEKAAMEPIGIDKTSALQPARVGGYAVQRVEAWAAERVRRDVRALLGRIDGYRVQGVELPGDHPEERELQTDPPLAPCCCEPPALRRIGIYQLKQPRSGRAGVLQNQAMKECGSAAWL